MFLDDLANALEHVKNILVMKMDPNTTQSQSDLTAELDRTVKKSMGKYIAVIILLFIRSLNRFPFVGYRFYKFILNFFYFQISISLEVQLPM